MPSPWAVFAATAPAAAPMKNLSGAAHAAPDAAATRDLEGMATFLGQGGDLGFLVGQVVLGSSEPCLADFAVDREIVVRLQVFGGNDGLRFCGLRIT
jgi:hypothetical protein